MPMQPFWERFGDLALEETRTILVRGHDRLPDGDYGFIELYCNEEDCDCRRVFLEVITPDAAQDVLATINFGWEPPEFYRRWATWAMSPVEFRELVGPSLGPWNRQSPLAPALMELARTSLLQDPEYVARLERHYSMFRESVDAASGSRRKAARGQTPRRKKRRR